MLEYAREFVAQEGETKDLRNFLDNIDSFSESDKQAFELLSSECGLKWSAQKIYDGDYSFYDDIYYFVEEWADLSPINFPEWLQIDYTETWDYIRLTDCGVFGNDEHEPFILYW